MSSGIEPFKMQVERHHRLSVMHTYIEYLKKLCMCRLDFIFMTFDVTGIYSEQKVLF